MTYPRTIIGDILQSGLTGTIGYTVLSADGTTLIARTTAGITEDGTSAIYSATVGEWDVSWSGTVIWDAGSGTLATEAFTPSTPQAGPTRTELGGRGITLH